MVMERTVSATRRTEGAPLRIACGLVSLSLSLVCVFSSFVAALGQSGSDAMTLWGFFAWGAGLAGASVWLIRGRSKGQPIVLVRDRRRILLTGVLAAVVVGLLIFMVTTISLEGDEWWPLILQTMFAVLFGTLPFLLFDRADYEERNRPVQPTAGQRRKIRRRIIAMSVAGGVAFAVGIIVASQGVAWWAEGLYRAGIILLGVSAVLAFQLRKAS